MPLAPYVRTVQFTNRANVKRKHVCTRVVVVVVSSRRAYLVDVVRRACAIGINVPRVLSMDYENLKLRHAACLRGIGSSSFFPPPPPFFLSDLGKRV